MAAPTIKQVAGSTPFDNTTNGYMSINVQDAIEESQTTAVEKARYTLLSAYNATANTGRWLEWFQSVPTNTNPYYPPRRSILTSLSLSVDGNATTTITIYKNNISVTTISLTAQSSATVPILNVPYEPTDYLSIQVTAGTCSRPSLFLFFQLDD